MNLRQLRKNKGMTMKELGAACDVTESTISNIEKGKRRPSYELMLKLAEALDCTVSDIMGEGGKGIGIAEQFVTFTIVGEVAAGYDHYAVQDWQDGEIDIPLSWLKGRSKEDYFVLRVCGQSMFPTYQDGDIVLVLKQSTMNHSGQIGVVMYDDDKATLKRVEFAPGEDWLKLSPINPQFPPVVLRGEELAHCRVCGIPKMVIRKVD